MVDFNVTGVGNPKIDASKWKKLTPQEIIKEQSKGEEIPPEIITWAQQMAAFAKIPDDVTYEQVDGDVGIDALNKLGIEDEEQTKLEAGNAEKPTETEDPDAVEDPNKAEKPEETDGDELVGELPESETAEKTEDDVNAGFSLADQSLTADNDEIRKRKERKGIQ